MLLAAPGASAADLRNVGRFHVTEVGTGAISLRWRDRSRGETRYEVLVDGPGAERSRIPRNRKSRGSGG